MSSNGSFYSNGLPISTAETGLGNVPTVPVATPAPSSFYVSGLPIGTTETGLGNVPTVPAATPSPSSFYVSGIPYGTAETGIGTAPVSSTPTAGSFYLDGTAYGRISNTDTITAALVASDAAIAASSASASSSASAAAASAAAAAATLAGALVKANNLSDLASVATAKVNLSLVKGDVGLGNVDNTSDVNKPVSTAQATADSSVASTAAAATALKANIASPALTGVPTAPTAAALNNTTQLATTAYADAATATLSGTVTTALALKAPLASPSFSGVVAASGTTASTSTTTGALTVAGGLGVAGDLNWGGGAMTGWTPTLTDAGGGTLGTTSASGLYKRLGKIVLFSATLIITTHGTASGYLQFTLPSTPTVWGGGGGDEEFVNGFTVTLRYAGTNLAKLIYYNNTPTATTDGVHFCIQGWYSE